MTLFRAKVLLAALALVVCATAARADLTLYMVEQPGCAWCRQWDREVSQPYEASATGARAPLVRVQLRDGAPDGVTFKMRAVFTPTFILVQSGQEIGRIEGYLSADFFWQHLDRMLATVPEP
jgi:hypothetical protein